MNRVLAGFIGFWAGGMFAATTFAAVSTTFAPLQAEVIYAWTLVLGVGGFIVGAAGYRRR